MPRGLVNVRAAVVATREFRENLGFRSWEEPIAL